MKKPKDINTPIDTKRFQQWIATFGSYRTSVIHFLVEQWLTQFKKVDRDLAARLLDSVMFYEHSSIASSFRSILTSLEGWNVNEAKRKGRWFFVSMSGSAGESGDVMLRAFRIGNSLNHKAYNSLFINRSDLVRQALTSDDTVVLVDDFSGTGNQICEVWNDPEVAFSELTAGAGSVFLIVVAATNNARKKIAKDTSLDFIAAHYLSDKDNIFSTSCTHFTEKEKEKILKYSSIADKKNPKGFGDCGLMIVFSHGCPNNSIPVLHANHNKWAGLFPRQL